MNYKKNKLNLLFENVQENDSYLWNYSSSSSKIHKFVSIQCLCAPPPNVFHGNVLHILVALSALDLIRNGA